MVYLIVLSYVCLCQAEKFDRLVHSFLEHLAEAERVLRYGVIPEEEEALLAFRKQHEVGRHLGLI